MIVTRKITQAAERLQSCRLWGGGSGLVPSLALETGVLWPPMCGRAEVPPRLPCASWCVGPKGRRWQLGWEP